MPRDERAARDPDPLSDVLSTLQLRGDVYARTEASPPWAIAFPTGPARFHLVERGEIWVQVDAVKSPLRASAGDPVIVPHGAAHTIGDRIGRRATALVDLLKVERSDGHHVFRVGAGKPETLLSCGRFHLESRGRDTSLAALPPLLQVRGHAGRPPQ